MLVAAAAVVACASAGAAGAPPGATARCSDGTYSFSAHRSGTCSHHGGVALWLTGGAAPVGAASSPPAARLVTGKTVLLRSRTRAAGCRVGARPDRRCSPGAYDAGLTKAVLCSPTFRTSTVRHVTESERHAVEREYGLSPRGYGSTLEIDHIVPLELGGSNDIANLFPERASFAGGDPGFHVKDKLENRLHELVCTGAMSLAAARRGIASDWIALSTNASG